MRHKRPILLRTCKEAVDILGGPTAVAKWLGLDQSTISGWIIRKQIGRGWHLHVYLTLQNAGYEVLPAVFGVDAWPDIIKPRVAAGARRQRFQKAASVAA